MKNLALWLALSFLITVGSCAIDFKKSDQTINLGTNLLSQVADKNSPTGDTLQVSIGGQNNFQTVNEGQTFQVTEESPGEYNSLSLLLKYPKGILSATAAISPGSWKIISLSQPTAGIWYFSIDTTGAPENSGNITINELIDNDSNPIITKPLTFKIEINRK